MSIIEDESHKKGHYFSQAARTLIGRIGGLDNLSELQQNILVRYGLSVANFLGKNRDKKLINFPQEVADSAFAAMLFRQEQAGGIYKIPEKLIQQTKRAVVFSLREIPIGGK